MTRFQKSRRGWVLLVSVLVILALFALCSGSRMPEINARSRQSKVGSEMRAISLSMDKYFQQHGSFPATRPLTTAAGDDASLIEEINEIGGADLLTFQTKVSSNPTFADLKDHFSPDRSLPYAYFANEARWMVSSPGPDADYDINPKTAMESDWTTNTLDLVHRTYDPTNGTFSDGDLYRMGWPPN